MNTELEEALKIHYQSLNKDAKKSPFLKLSTYSTLIGIIGFFFGFYQIESKKIELAKEESKLKITQMAAKFQQAITSLERDKALKIDKESEVIKREIEANELKISTLNTDKSLLEQEKDEVQGDLQVEKRLLKLNLNKLKETQKSLDKTTKDVEKAKATYDEFKQRIEKADELLGNVFKYLNDTQLTEQAMCELISIKSVVASRRTLSIYSPSIISVFVSYPDYYRTRLQEAISFVTYRSDIDLVDGAEPKLIPRDKNGNHWVWQYKGNSAPTYVLATFDYLKGAKKKQFSIKVGWDLNGNIIKSNCDDLNDSVSHFKTAH